MTIGVLGELHHVKEPQATSRQGQSFQDRLVRAALASSMNMLLQVPTDTEILFR